MPVELSAMRERSWLRATRATYSSSKSEGQIHALTPGHGKSVLASYLIGSRLAMLRSLAVGGVLALTHVGAAVILALLAAPLVIRTLGSGVGRVPALEFLSWSLLSAIGLWLLIRALRGVP